MTAEVSHDLMAYATKVIDALKGVDGKASYGEFHLSAIPILFDGEETGWQVAKLDESYWALCEVETDV